MPAKFPDPTSGPSFDTAFAPPGSVPGLLDAPPAGRSPRRRRRALAITLVLTLLVAIATAAAVVVPAVLQLRDRLTAPTASQADAAAAAELDLLAGQWQASVGDLLADYPTGGTLPDDTWLEAATPLVHELADDSLRMRALAAQIETDELDTAASELADSASRATGYARGLVAAVAAHEPETAIDERGALRFSTLEAGADRSDLQSAARAAGIG